MGEHHAHTLGYGITGVVAPVLGLIASFATDLELWLRILALSLTCLVSATAYWKMLKGPKT